MGKLLPLLVGATDVGQFVRVDDHALARGDERRNEDTDAVFEHRRLVARRGRLPLHHGLFDRDAIILTTASRRVRLFSNKGQRSVTLSHPGLPYLGIWHTPNSDAPFVCLEPWLAMPGRDGVVEDLMTAPGLVRLAPGASYENGWTIAVS